MVTDGGATQDPRIFRVYEDGNSLLFVNAGHYHMNGMGLVQQMRREADARRRGEAPPPSGQGLADKAVETVSTAWVTYIEGYKKSKAQADPRHRAPLLDVMTLEELRAEAQTDKYSFIVRRENVSDVKLRPRKTGFSFDEKGIEGFLTFTHTQTGKWPIKLLTVEDYEDAVGMVERVIGADRIKKG